MTLLDKYDIKDVQGYIREVKTEIGKAKHALLELEFWVKKVDNELEKWLSIKE